MSTIRPPAIFFESKGLIAGELKQANDGKQAGSLRAENRSRRPNPPLDPAYEKALLSRIESLPDFVTTDELKSWIIENYDQLTVYAIVRSKKYARLIPDNVEYLPGDARYTRSELVCRFVGGLLLEKDGWKKPGDNFT